METRHKKFANGDSYIGGWKSGMPSGEGKYLWADGSVYTGSWRDGAKHGVGTYTWPSRASYHGEWQSGFMHGVGSFEAPDGSRYSGGWRKDAKHGLGRKTYSNGDSYEGLWDTGRPHGPGRYVWADGNEYDGEWRQGKMEGQGTFVWSTGERYDGGWRDGREDGLGLFTFADGATYRGFWEAGKKHGVGVQRPPPTGPSGGGGGGGGAQHAHHSPGTAGGGGRPGAGGAAAAAQGTSAKSALSHEAAAEAAVAAGGPGGIKAEEGGAVRDGGSAAGGSGQQRASSGGSGGGGVAGAAVGARAGGMAAAAGLPAGVVLVKEYDHGRLVRQSLLQASEALHILGKPDRVRRQLNHGLRHTRKTTRLGQLVYKDNSSFDLMVGLQAGIRWSVTRAQPAAEGAAPGPPAGPGPRPLPPEAFERKLVAAFPRGGSVDTPLHRASSDFEWRDYCPLVFRNLRDAFGWQPSDMVQELCSDQALRLLNSPGKSGSVFFLSADDKLLVKTIRKAEFDLLRRLLPAYYCHMLAHPNSLLVRVYGLYSITSASSGGRKVRFVVMANLFSTDLQIHERYDLKGSTVGRTAGKDAVARARQGDPRVVLKDLDLGGRCFKLEAQWHERLMEQIASDCALLEACGVMDYSMLLGVHDRARGPRASGGGSGGGGSGGGAGGGAAPRGGHSRRVSAASLAMLEEGGEASGGGGDAASEEPWSGDEGGARPGTPPVLAASSPGGVTEAEAAAAAAEALAADGMPAAAAVNFEEHKADDEAALQRRMARIEARVGALDLGLEAKQGLLQLARLEMLAAAPRHARRGGGGGGGGPVVAAATSVPARRGALSVLAARPKRSDTMRPVAFTEGSSDALALSLGQSRVQLGAAMAATALPPGGGGTAMAAAAAAGAGGAQDSGDAPSGARDVVLFFGIIDIFTVYDSLKRLEHVVKAVGSAGRGGARAISAVPPAQYSRRFHDFMKRVFV